MEMELCSIYGWISELELGFSLGEPLPPFHTQKEAFEEGLPREFPQKHKPYRKCITMIPYYEFSNLSPQK